MRSGAGPQMDWAKPLGNLSHLCGRRDLNPHALPGATPSRWCVCQFHHFRELDTKFERKNSKITHKARTRRLSFPFCILIVNF
jgi:hypothetical protein